MKRIILHIGQQKTGSTALQYFLEMKKNKLSEKGICYYSPCFRYAPWGGKSNGDFLLANVLDKLKEPTDPIKKDMFNKNDSLNVFYLLKKNSDQDHFEIEKINFMHTLKEYDTIILSEEMFFHYDYFYDNFWDVVNDYLHSCTNEELVIDVLTYLRRQDDWFLAKWKEDVGTPIASSWTFNKALKEYEKFGFLNYYDTLLRLERVFGRQHLIIRNYDRKQLYNNNIIDDLFHVCDIDFDCGDSNNFNSINPGRPLTCAYGFSAIDRGLVKTNISRYQLYYGSMQYYRYASETSRKTQALKNSERLRLLKRCKANNDKISEHFFDGNNFFDDSIYTEKYDYRVLKSNPLTDIIFAKILIKNSTI